MNDLGIFLAVEDSLGEAVAEKIIASVGGLSVRFVFPKTGFGDLKKNIGKFNEIAKTSPLFLLTDLDNTDRCPPELIKAWLPGTRNERLLFRIAVVEVESWVLAHRQAFAEFLGIDVARVTQDPDSVPDPKQELVNLARKSRRKTLREALVPLEGGTSRQGPDYNSRLGEFVKYDWAPEIAARSSDSLRRTLARVGELRSATSSYSPSPAPG